jgi:hypothetical protein
MISCLASRRRPGGALDGSDGIDSDDCLGGGAKSALAGGRAGSRIEAFIGASCSGREGQPIVVPAAPAERRSHEGDCAGEWNS